MAFTLTAACGGKQSARSDEPAGAHSGGPETPSPASDDSGDTGAANAPAAASTQPLATDAPTEAECVVLVDHTLAIGLEDQRKNKPAELVPTAEQVAEIRAALITEMTPTCRTLPRPVYACVMAASDREAMIACDPTAGPAPQR